MKFSSYQTLLPLSAAVAAATLLTGCGGGGSSSKAATLDSEWTFDAVDTIEQVVPGCQGRAVAQSVLDTVQMSLTQVEELVDLASVSALSDDGDGKQYTPKSFAINGPCGGQVFVDSDHAKGITDYSMDFQQYCLNTEDGDSLLLGTIEAKQVGKPTDFGPEISELRSEINNLEVSQGNERMIISVDGARTRYGRPATWSPATPTTSNPDQVTVNRVTLNNESRGQTDRITGFSAERVGPRDMAAIIVKGGRYTEGDTGEHFELSTPADNPMVINMDAGHWQSGALELKGAGNSRVEVTPGNKGEFIMVVAGETSGQQADCKGANAPSTHMVELLIDELPIY